MKKFLVDQCAAFQALKNEGTASELAKRKDERCNEKKRSVQLRFEASDLNNVFFLNHLVLICGTKVELQNLRCLRKMGLTYPTVFIAYLISPQTFLVAQMFVCVAT